MNTLSRPEQIKHQSLVVKLTSFLAIFILVSGLLLGMALAWMYSHYENKRLVETLSTELEIVSYAASAGVEFNDLKTIEEGVLLLRNVKEFVNVRVTNLEGAILFERDFSRGKKVSRGYDFLVTVPVFNAVNAKVGQIEAVATSAYLNVIIRRTLWVVLVAGFPSAVLAIFFVAFFLRKFLAPLGRLKEAIDRVSKDGFTGRVDVVSNDEVGDLALSFNAMSENLRNTTVSRNDLIREVDERVKAQENLQRMLEEARRMQEALRSAQERLVQSEKLAAIGQLAAGVAHEINNPAGFVASNLEVLETYVAVYLKVLGLAEKLKGAVERQSWVEASAAAGQMEQLIISHRIRYIVSDSQQLVHQSRDGIDRIKKIVTDLKVFAHEGTKWLEECVKIEIVIEMALSIAHNELRYRIDLRKDYGNTLPVNCCVQKMGQVFLNLIVNAAQAISGDGIITIKTYQEPGSVCVDVIDTGCGISEANMKKIFDPFFTTKPIGTGTGLGLSISYELVKKQGGEIRVRSVEGKGSTFTVVLPLSGL
ncbi:MAG: ATP-binding protein [Candidatus Omnitrophota bacterium]